MIKRNIFTKSIVIALLALSGATSGVWAQTKTVVLSFNKANIQATSATVNVSGTGAIGVTATVGRATQTASNTPTNFFTTGAGYNDNVLGVNYTNSVNNYWEIPFTITGLRTDLEYTITTEMVLLNNVGNKQTDGTQRTWIETIYVNGAQHATTGNVTMYNGNASSVNRTFNPFTPTSPLNLTVRMQRTDANGCFAGIKSITLSYNENAGLTLEQIYGSPALQNGEFANDTKWYSIRSHRRNNCYFSVSNNIDANENLNLVNSSAPTNNGGYWCFVAEENGGFSIRNRAYGPEYVLASVSDGNNVNVRMYHVSELANTNSYIFDFVENSNGADAVAFRFRGTTDSNINASNNSPFPIMRWNADGNRTATDQGSAFYLAQISDATLNAAQPYTAYKVNIEKADASAIANYANNTDIIGLQSVPNGKYMLIKSNVTPVKANFTLSGVSYLFDVETTSPANQPKLLTFYEQDATDFTSYTVRLVGEESLIKNLSVTMSGLRSAKRVNIAGNGEILHVKNGVDPLHIDFSIDAPADKFVWGPVIDAENKTVTYEIRERAESMPTGWYQLQLANNAADITALANKIKSNEGNINTQANTLYLAPSVYDAGSNKVFKATGVPTYADETATFVYVEKLAENNYSIYNTRTGEKLLNAFTFNGGQASNSSWSFESAANPIEGPFLLTSGNASVVFNVAAADMTKYDVYKIAITGDVNAANVKLSVNNQHVCGHNIVCNGGFLLVKAGNNAPHRTQFSVASGNATINTVIVGAEHEGVTTITVNVSEAKSYWRAKITGDAKRSTDRIIYNNIEYVNDALIGLPQDTAPTALMFKTNVTDRFVWGPIFDKENKTVTFEVLDPASSLTAGKWYQMVLRDKPGQVQDGGVKASTSMVDDINKMYHLRHKSNYIYPITANATDWPVELTGITGNEMKANTYIYVRSVATNSATLMMQNDMHLNQNGQGYSATNNSVPLVYQPETKTFKWNSNALPWENLRSNVGIGNTGNAQSGNMEFFMVQAPVKAYKIAGLNGTKVKYIGESAACISNKILSDGFFFMEEGSDFERNASAVDVTMFSSQSELQSISETTQNGITVLTFNFNTPVYNREIIHRQAYYYDDLEDETDKPGAGFIQTGEGMSSRQGKNGTIHEQNMAVYEIPIYMKQGTDFTSYLPTDQVRRYQRWYDYDTDSQVDATILRSLAGWNVSAANTYNNGHLTGGGYGGYRNNPQFFLPAGVEEYNVGLDMAHYPTRGTVGSGATQSLIEPTLAMRIVYQLRDAKQIAKAIKTKTENGDFYEVHNISFPNVKHGTTEDKTLSSLMPLDMDLNNYWIFDGSGETNADLLQLLSSNGAQLEVELAQYSEGAQLKNVMMIPSGASAASGNIKYSSFNTGHFVLFQYPDGGVVPANSTATINVYIKKPGSSQRYNLAQFNLTFIGNSEPVVITQLKDSFRHPDNLQAEYGLPVAELTFDNKTNNEFGGFYRYPLDYKGVSYAYGTMVAGGGHTGWFASRGEYSLTTEAGSSKALGGGSYNYYPVGNYLRNMRDTNAAFTGRETDNYFLYIDAADQPGKVASIALEDALCAGSRLYCYGYIGCTSGGTDQNPTSILINVMGVNKHTGKEELVYSYCPGIVTLRGYDKVTGEHIYATPLGCGTSYEPHGSDANYWAPWQQVGFSFTISTDVAEKMSSYSIQIMNNAYNSDGADTVLDDFAVYVKKPGAEVMNTTPLCSDQIRHIKVVAEYDALIEAAGEDSNHDGKINVGFCFLDKEIYDNALKDYADNMSLPRTDSENTYNKAFGLALMGRRTIDQNYADHAFHTFNIIRDGEYSNAYGESKIHYYEDIPKYSFKESGDDTVYRDSIRGERYIVFKESVSHEDDEEGGRKWIAGKEYYLLFTTNNISETHVNNHDLACTVFNLDDNRCAILYEFTVAPPVSIKGDVEEITSGDEVQACAGQTATLTVNLNGRTDTKDVIIKNLNYDWWMSAPTHEVYKMENGVPVRDAEDNRIPVLDGDGQVQVKEYNTVPATLQNYMNVWYGVYQQDNKHLDKKKGDKIYLSDALLELRRAYPDVVDLDTVVPVHKTGDTIEYELTQDMINCVAHFLQPDENGYPPLLLMKKEMNLTLGIDYADENKVVHFVVIPIAPGIYSVDEDAIYCPDPQELKVKLLNEAPSLANGFNDKQYPEEMNNVPMRVGLQQINGVRMVESGTQNTLTVPLRKVKFAYPEEAQRLVKSIDNTLYIVGTNDPAYKEIGTGIKDQYGNFRPEDDEIEEMFIEAGYVEMLQIEKEDQDPYMRIVFDNGVKFREGYTYTLKVKYLEMKSDDTRDKACEGSFVFDMKIVPEYQMWAGKDADWTNDKSWRRADVEELYAQNAKENEAQKVITGATPLHHYMTNEANETNNSFVPMYFTNVVMDSNATAMPQLYEAKTIGEDGFIVLPSTNADSSIRYDLSVKPILNTDNAPTGNYDCEIFGTNICRGINFQPASYLMNAHLLKYDKAWVEYKLETDRWYTLSSPLQDTYAGEWFAPTGTTTENAAKQLTPYFYTVNWEDALNDRFRPAFYQRSWDSEGNINNLYLQDGSDCNAYIANDWSYVYNDVLTPYEAGGFSVKVSTEFTTLKPEDGYALVRMPKDDKKYTYFDIDGQTHNKADDTLPELTDRYRLWSDREEFTQQITNAVPTNNFFLVGNPYMANLNMDEFFKQNPQLEKAYWVMTENNQTVSVRAAYDNNNTTVAADERWTLARPDGDFVADSAVVAPLQGFFVKTKAVTNTTAIKYTLSMQTAHQPVLRSRAMDFPDVDPGWDDDDDDEPTPTPQDVYSISGMTLGTTHSLQTTRPRTTIVVMKGKKVAVGE